jgi:uncharacterized protein (DUF697 family)
MELATLTPLTTRTINRHALLAAGAGLIPVPVLDLAVISGIQFDLIRQLATCSGTSFDPARGKAWIASLTGTFAAQLGAGLVKALPGIGSLIGGMSLVVSAGAATYALGQIVATHFANGGSMESFKPEEHQQTFKAYEEEGIEAVIEMREEQARANEKVRELEKMHAHGLITEAEYDSVKARVLAAV